jgi:glycosyltransferase involved in cell wall biosynthesis
MHPNLTVVIPAYNEEESLREFLPEVTAYCREKGYKLIVVNDGSRDMTQQVLEQYTGTCDLKIIRHKVNRGYGGAIKSGVLEADTKYVITIDADGQHHPSDIEKLCDHIKTHDADMVVGSRKGAKSASYYRETGKWIIRKIARILMPVNIYDINSGMKIYDTALAKKYIKLCPDSMAYSDIIALVFISQRHLVLETPINIRERKGGKSTISTRTALETVKEILNIVILFNPMRVFFPISVMLILISIIWDIHIFLRGDGVSVGTMLGIMTGVIFFVLGLLAEQLAIIRKNIS